MTSVTRWGILKAFWAKVKSNTFYVKLQWLLFGKNLGYFLI